MKKVWDYLCYLFRFRYFWAYLARSDLISRFRRSKMGMLWMVLSPLLLTLIMAFVFGTVFRQPMREYAPYILAGTVSWEFISSSMVGNGMTFIINETYIRQFNHPVTIYTLKATVVSSINFLIGSIGLAIWSLFIHPMNTVMGLMTLPLTVLLFFLLGWGLSTIASFLNVKYRDYPQIMALLMQVVWYMSPVFFQESMFLNNVILRTWFHINPITHLLYLMRKPFLYGQMPSPFDYGVAVLAIALVGLIAVWMNRKNSRRVIFYL